LIKTELYFLRGNMSRILNGVARRKTRQPGSPNTSKAILHRRTLFRNCAMSEIAYDTIAAIDRLPVSQPTRKSAAHFIRRVRLRLFSAIN
jgi:hypothetical protein